ncbi:MAG: NUDIX hydrolase [Ottowia sp.]|nr:NUDIX hydrolase [Ottowia sp.]
MKHRPIKHCRRCGSVVVYRIPDDGDTRERAVCPVCGEIHYANPLIVTGTVPTWGRRILLCRRAIEPRQGKWTLPAGFMELDETLAQGAARETVEESGADFYMGPLFSALSVPRVGQVHFFFLATLRSAALAPGPESLEAGLFDEADIPWDELAFPTIRKTLEFFLADRRRGRFDVHTWDISQRMRS